MKTILLLTNFSKASTNAISSFLNVFSQYLDEEYKFILLNAYSQPHFGKGVLINIEDTLELYSNSDLKEEQKKYLEIIGEKKIQFDIASYNGDILEAIDFISKKNKIHLILMGSKGSNIIKELLISNNTSRIINRSKTPVLIIPENAILSKPERLVLASDTITTANKEEFKIMLERLAFIKAELLVLNVYKDEKPDTTGFESFMNKNLKTINHSFHYIQDPDIAHGISSFVRKFNFAILALIGHNGSLLSKLFNHSISNKLAFKAEQPVLILNADSE